MDAPIVSTQAGPVQGRVHDGIESFLEVPYAAAPVGPLRFKPPQPRPPWAGVRPADHWQYRAPQLPSRGTLRAPKKLVAMLGEPYAPAMTEDSLTVNVWTPSSTDAGRRPVMFFIHGGLYVLGQAGMPAYDGEAFARRHDVVFVSVTHRLNAFGFLYLDSIGGADYRGSGNAGLLDLVAALQWVRDNIAAFGGDPDCVTISGESGGALQVSLLMIMEQANGLFHRAVCESGFALVLKTPEEAEKYAAALIAELGGGVSAAVSAPMEELLAAQARIVAKNGAGPPTYLGPVLDGVVFSQTPEQVWDGGRGSTVPLLAGWTLDEVVTFSRQDIDADIPVLGMPRAGDPEKLEGGQSTSGDGGLGAISSLSGGRDAAPVIAARRALFPGEPDAVLARRLMSEIQFRLPAERAAVARDAAGSATYLYRMEWESPVMRPLGVPHCTGIAPFFANEQLVAFTRDNDEARALAETMSSALAAFMRTGDPSTDSLAWPRYQADTRDVMILDRESRVMRNPEPTVRLAFDKLRPEWVA